MRTATNLTDHNFTNYIVTDLPSSGIWAMMSGELKIGSKYSHVACTFSHSSMISCVSISLPSHSLKTKPHKYHSYFDENCPQQIKNWKWSELREKK